MTRRQAEAEARRRWGRRAAIKRERAVRMKGGGPHAGQQVCMTCCRPDCTARWSYKIGRITYLGGVPFAFFVEGRGHSWAEAFEHAERRR